MVYIGIDLHRKRSQVAALDESGQLLFNRRVRIRPSELLDPLGQMEGAPLEVAFEATFGWGWLADLLADVGIPTHHELPARIDDSVFNHRRGLVPGRPPFPSRISSWSDPLTEKRPS